MCSLKVHLGGGTDITKALLVREHAGPPAAATIVVLITDFFEGRDESDLVAQTRLMAEAGCE